MTEVNEKHKLRDYKGYRFMDAGVRVAGENGVNLNALEIMDCHGAVSYTLLFNEGNPDITLNKTIEKAKVWVNERRGIYEEADSSQSEQTETPRYSNIELAAFKCILDKKVEEAVQELGRLRSIEEANDGPDREECEKLSNRQNLFIDHLYLALKRIEDKTYGICKITGKMIPKERLLKVPYATMSEEGKAIAAKQQVVDTAPPVKEKKERKPREKKRKTRKR